MSQKYSSCKNRATPPADIKGKWDWVSGWGNDIIHLEASPGTWLIIGIPELTRVKKKVVRLSPSWWTIRKSVLGNKDVKKTLSSNYKNSPSVLTTTLSQQEYQISNSNAKHEAEIGKTVICPKKLYFTVLDTLSYCSTSSSMKSLAISKSVTVVLQWPQSAETSLSISSTSSPILHWLRCPC